MDFFAGIDGTGVYDDARYDQEMRDSFVSRLYRSSRFGLRYYVRGPWMDGGTAKSISKEMLREVDNRLHQRGGRAVERLILAGYSRGGAIAIRVARELAAHGHKVHCLLLFDAVDRSLAIAARQVPANVRYCFHAYRDPASRSRTSWRNCGTEPESRDRSVTLFEPMPFLCTHGGMGGVPWTEADPDGIINEAFTGRRTADALDAARRSSPFTAPGNPLGVAGAVLADAANDWHRRASRTAITLKQDRLGSQQVGNWMFGRLAWALKQKAAEPVAVG